MLSINLTELCVYLLCTIRISLTEDLVSDCCAHVGQLN